MIELKREGEKVSLVGAWPEYEDFDVKFLNKIIAMPSQFMRVSSDEGKAIFTLSNACAEYRLDKYEPGITTRRGHLLPGSTVEEA